MQLRLADYPQLKLIAWNRGEDALIDEQEALALYERNWRYVNEPGLSLKEKDLIQRLVQQYGHGVLLV